MAVAGKAQICGQSRQIVVLRNHIQGSRETQPQMITIQGNAFDLLEDLRQIYRRAANFGGDIRKCPAPGQIAGQQDFDAVREAAAGMSCSRRVRGARPQAAAHQGQQQTFGLQRLNGTIVQAMPKQCDQRLCARIDALILAAEPELSAIIQKSAGRQFTQDGYRQAKRQACIAPCERMTDPITFASVEKKNVVGICHRLIATHVPQVNATIGKYEMRGRNTFFRAAMTASTAAPDVPQRHSIRVQQMIDFELGHSRQIGLAALSRRAELSMTANQYCMVELAAAIGRCGRAADLPVANCSTPTRMRGTARAGGDRAEQRIMQSRRKKITTH
jgi:hypothetical protein